MLSSKEIRNVKFSKSMSGYKQEEVDVLLDKIEADYDQFERTLREMSSKIEQLRGEVEEYKSSQGSIQSVLVSAQKLADQIVEEAKVKSSEIIADAQKSIENITAREQELTSAFDKKAGERKEALENQVEGIIKTAEDKKAAVEKATQDSVERQQMLFDKLKIEIAAFKADITKRYKEHIEILSKLPDTVPMDPKEIAAAVSQNLEAVPDVREFLANAEAKMLNNNPAPAFEEDVEYEDEEPTGFVISADDFEQTETEDDLEDIEE